MEAWDEIRTAFHVARQGTVSGAAAELGVHHATVIRHIDALEARLGTKLFQRHARGYTPTEAGRDLLQVAQTTDDQFTQLVGRLKGRGDTVTGELLITSLAVFSPLLVPAIASFQANHPEVVTRFLTAERLFRLEYGEAHIAVRAGQPPEQLDNVVQHLFTNRTALFASREYIEAHGMPEGDADLKKHMFIGPDEEDSRAPFYKWMKERVPRSQVVFRTTDAGAVKHAILEGVGLGFMPLWEAKENPDLVQVVETRTDWDSPLWLVTHVDLHRTVKVQALLKHLKKSAQDWG
ncbi:LysR family transcriptional regulator [Meridianimarinicoccus aquatilis]|uniref:LysR family transcriptional regulator n=1 Tax=Meridianimarinicoccus aquatilis TaxID=2552766 RepID=A0A4R6ARJ4_9RHOB|nr:LysR family transcriptional regulator [Fluviibacterium aquatile]TDL86114.1 LysR family transcriptional regulator [Fluviibacterium aquatile]